MSRFPKEVPALGTSDVTPIDQLLDTSLGTWRESDEGCLSNGTGLIAATWPFSQLPLSVVRSFVAALQPRSYAVGDVLVRQGEPTRELIVLLRGEAEVSLHAGGREQLLVPSPHVNVLGEIGLLTTRHSTTTVIATTPVEAGVWSAEQFNLVDNLSAQARVDRELQIGRSLAHPGLLAVYEGFEDLSTSFIAMEFCDGPSLASVIETCGPLSEPDIRCIIGQLAAVLSYLHERGICHRDLKPANVLFNSQGELKLADFGLARSANCTDLTASHELLGTPCYMAPEQLQGDRADCRADLFAVGCLIWEMLTGERLFNGGSVLEILLHHANFSLPEPNVIRPGLSRDIFSVMRNSLVREPQSRTLDLNRLAAWSSAFRSPAIHK
ncbi:MAG: protein kinase [Planctomycetia bacterium]|nr:protein kinase [Planctomycetia bacterium]